MFRSRRTTLVKRLWKFRINDETKSSSQNEICRSEDLELKSVTQSFFKGLKESQLEALVQAMESKCGETTPCVPVMKSELHLGKYTVLPYIICCKFFRWPNLTSDMKMKRLPCCSKKDMDKVAAICCNPYHWSLVVKIDQPRFAPIDLDTTPTCGWSTAPEPAACTGTRGINTDTKDSGFMQSHFQLENSSEIGQSENSEWIREGCWCNIAYWEHNQRVGRLFPVTSPSVRIFQQIHHGDGMCLESFQQPTSNDVVRRTREKVGFGIILSREAACHTSAEAPQTLNIRRDVSNSQEIPTSCVSFDRELCSDRKNVQIRGIASQSCQAQRDQTTCSDSHLSEQVQRENVSEAECFPGSSRALSPIYFSSAQGYGVRSQGILFDRLTHVPSENCFSVMHAKCKDGDCRIDHRSLSKFTSQILQDGIQCDACRAGLANDTTNSCRHHKTACVKTVANLSTSQSQAMTEDLIHYAELDSTTVMNCKMHCNEVHDVQNTNSTSYVPASITFSPFSLSPASSLPSSTMAPTVINMTDSSTGGLENWDFSLTNGGHVDMICVNRSTKPENDESATTCKRFSLSEPCDTDCIEVEDMMFHETSQHELCDRITIASVSPLSKEDYSSSSDVLWTQPSGSHYHHDVQQREHCDGFSESPLLIVPPSDGSKCSHLSPASSYALSPKASSTVACSWSSPLSLRMPSTVLLASSSTLSPSSLSSSSLSPFFTSGISNDPLKRVIPRTPVLTSNCNNNDTCPITITSTSKNHVILSTLSTMAKISANHPLLSSSTTPNLTKTKLSPYPPPQSLTSSSAHLSLDEPNKVIWAYNASDFPIFVNSPTLDELNSPRSVVVKKVPPGHSIKIFDYARAALLEKSLYYSKLQQEGPHEMCSVRISMGKGWGPHYSRQFITSCPCWLELWFERASHQQQHNEHQRQQ